MESTLGVNMTLEERLQKVMGTQAFALAVLETQLEQANAKIAELEKPKDPKEKLKAG